MFIICVFFDISKDNTFSTSAATLAIVPGSLGFSVVDLDTWEKLIEHGISEITNHDISSSTSNSTRLIQTIVLCT